MKKLTISIVNYNAGEYLIKCLDSLRNIKDEAEFDVFVIDNASADGSFERAQKKFSEFNFIKNEVNFGSTFMVLLEFNVVLLVICAIIFYFLCINTVINSRMK